MGVRHHLFVVLGLVLLTVLVQTVVCLRAATVSRDTVRLVRTSRTIQSEGLAVAMDRDPRPPLFPLAVVGMHAVLTSVGLAGPSLWTSAAVAVSTLAMVLTVPLIYLTANRLVGSRAAILAGVFFAVIPDIARLGADASRDSLHLLLFAAAFWAAQEAIARRNSARWFFLCGAMTALAVMTRIESLVLLVVMPLAFCLVAANVAGEGEVHPRRVVSVAGSAVMLLAGLLLVWTPYLARTDSLAPRAAAMRLLGRESLAAAQSAPLMTTMLTGWTLPSGEPAGFDLKEHSVSSRQRGFAAAAVRTVRSLAAGYGYWIGLLAIVGLPRWKGSSGIPRGQWFARTLFVVFILVAMLYSAREGYLEARHLMPAVVIGLGTAGAGTLVLAGWLASKLRFKGTLSAGVTIGVTLLAVVACLPWTFAPIHTSRFAHRQAGEWLAMRTVGHEIVVDTHGLASLYAGTERRPLTEADVALVDPATSYLVVQREELQFNSRRGQTLRALTAAAGPEVAVFPPSAADSNETRIDGRHVVLVYRWNEEALGRLPVATVQIEREGTH